MIIAYSGTFCPAFIVNSFRQPTAATFLREEGFYSSFSEGAVAQQGD